MLNVEDIELLKVELAKTQELKRDDYIAFECGNNPFGEGYLVGSENALRNFALEILTITNPNKTIEAPWRKDTKSIFSRWDKNQMFYLSKIKVLKVGDKKPASKDEIRESIRIRFRQVFLSLLFLILILFAGALIHQVY